MALSTLDTAVYVEAPTGHGTSSVAGRSKWVPLGNDELFGGTSPVVTIADGMGTVNHDQLNQYTNAILGADPAQAGTHGMAGMGLGDGSGTGDTNAAPVASDTDESNFDAAGRLIIPMEINTDTTDDLTDIRPLVSATNTVAAIRTLVDNSRIAAEALKKARDEHTGVNQRIYDEAYRRAQLEADYYAARWAEVLADTHGSADGSHRNWSSWTTNSNGVE